ncbi:uncharacterized protein EMH_0021770 [Eimeria mitis]|uniref:Phosphatidate cytidylyltransferase, mitochondrial n=1 Tax=Eimeria mitis TaxID=44415 RepID=U6KMF7_9EIME|nr:uncharacterized protein EMH_0021770 [Eimeria mitis]CDJ36638.1 hypothetical protein, conserved [Eimeria mitis]
MQLRLALLLLPDAVSLECLLREIVSLSYRGDFRVLFAEDPNKAQAIVNGQGADLCSIYLPLLSEIPSVHLEVEGGPLGTQGPPVAPGGPPLLQKAFSNTHAKRGPQNRRDKFCPVEFGLSRILVRQDRSPAALSALYDPLPLSLRWRAEYEGPPGAPSSTAGGGPPAGPPPVRALRLGLQQLVFGPTLKCSLKNAVSAGFGASVLYSLHKLGKRLGLR